MNLSRRELLKGLLATTAIASIPVAEAVKPAVSKTATKEIGKYLGINIKGIKEKTVSILDVGNGWHRIEIYGISSPEEDTKVTFEKQDEHIILAKDNSIDKNQGGYTPGEGITFGKGITLSTNDNEYGVKLWGMQYEQPNENEMCYSVYVKFPEKIANNLSPIGDEHYAILAA